MKCTSSHVALLAVLMFGLTSATYLYGQATGGPGRVAPPAVPPPAASPGGASSSEIDNQPAPGGGRFGNYGADQPQEYRTIRIEHADASVLAKQLKDLVPYSAVVGDARTNQIIIHGPKEVIETVLSLIKQLDVPDAQRAAAPTPGGFTFGLVKPAMPMASAPNSSTIGAGIPSWKKASEEYSDWAAGDETGIQQKVLKMLQGLNDYRAFPSGDAPQELKVRIDHLLSEQARRATEEAQRADEKAQQANQQAQKARALGDDEQRLAAEQARRAADDARRTAEQARRTIEELQRALQSNAAAAEQAQRASEETRRAMEVDGRIAALSDTIRKLEAGDLTDKQKAILDNAKTQLKDQLSTQFDERQKAESEELQQLRQRLDKLEKEISDRAQNRDKLINSRLDDLISGKAVTNSGGQEGMILFTTPTMTIRGGPSVSAVAPVPGIGPSAGAIHVEATPGTAVMISGPAAVMSSSASPPPPEAAAANSSDAVTPPQPPGRGSGR